MSRDMVSSNGLGAATDRSTLIAFVLMVLFGGGNTVAVRLSNFGLPPFWGAATRVAAAALIFWVIVGLRRIALPRGRALLGAVLYGLLNFAVAGAFVYWGLVRVPAGLGSTILALVPLMTFFFVWAHRLEAFRWRGVVGALVATAGVAIGVAGGFGGAIHVPAVLAVVAAAASLAEGAVVFKLFPRSHPLVSNAVAFKLAEHGRHLGRLWLPGADRLGGAVLSVCVHPFPLDRTDDRVLVPARSRGHGGYRRLASGRGHYSLVPGRRRTGAGRRVGGGDPGSARGGRSGLPRITKQGCLLTTPTVRRATRCARPLPALRARTRDVGRVFIPDTGLWDETCVTDGRPCGRYNGNLVLN